jgi:hypothetical protein
MGGTGANCPGIRYDFGAHDSSFACLVAGVGNVRGQRLAGSDIFISYSRQDRHTAEQFAASLEKEGFVVWWDDAIHSGETFDEVIEEELRSAKAVVVLWSPRSVISRWVRAEATIADRRRKLVPAIIEPCEKPIIFELTQTVDLSHWQGDNSDRFWRIFVKDLCRMTGKPEVPGHSAAAAPVAPPPARSSFAHTRVAPLPMPANGAAELDEDEEYNPTQAFSRMTEEELGVALPLHWLEMMQDGKVKERVPIGPAGLRIGRTAPAELILSDPRVSRAHCRVELVAGEVQVTDLNSTNGTYVDEIRVTGSALLPAGSTLKVGTAELVYQIRQRGEA